MAQGGFEVSAVAGYQFWGGLDGILADGTPVNISIEDAGNWGGAVAYRVEETIRFEVSYLNQSTEITARNQATGITSKLFDASVQYIQAGAIYEAPTGGKNITPYGGLTVGVAILNPDKGDLSSESRLAFGFNGGVKVYIAETFGLKAQASLLMPIQFSSGSLFCGSSGCTVGATGGTAILQGAVTGGLFVEL